jgi:hypothetical protein
MSGATIGSSRPRRSGWPWVVAVAAVFVLAAVGVAVFGRGGDVARVSVSGPAARLVSVQSAKAVRLSFTGGDRPIPASFVGISMEYPEVASFESHGVLFGRVLSVMRPGNESLMPLRVGGRTANGMYWNTPTGHAPAFVFELGRAWLGGLAGLARADGLSIKLDLNLPVHSPAMAVAFARAASRALPRGRLAELAIGNEPDFYYKQLQYEQERTATTLKSTPRDWAVGYSARDYWRDFQTYARRLHAALPGVPVAGPDIPPFAKGWVRGAPSPSHDGPQAIEVHHYGASTCWGPANAPTVRRLLAPGAVDGLEATAGHALAFAHAHQLPFYFTEVNAVSLCGDTPVAKSFATALWAPDALFEMIAAGIDGINLHLRSTYINAPFHLGSAGLTPHPELYGLALFARMLGPQAQLSGVRLLGADRLNVKAWAVKSQGGLRVLLIDKDSRSVDVTVPAGTATAPAQLERLQAPSPQSDSGVTLAGQRIGRDGRWYHPRVITTVPIRHSAYHVHVPAYSATILAIARVSAPR